MLPLRTGTLRAAAVCQRCCLFARVRDETPTPVGGSTPARLFARVDLRAANASERVHARRPLVVDRPDWFHRYRRGVSCNFRDRGYCLTCRKSLKRHHLTPVGIGRRRGARVKAVGVEPTTRRLKVCP